MEKIREHIERNLADANRVYDETYYHFTRAKEAFNSAKAEFESLTTALAKANEDTEYFQKLLNELNKNEIANNK
jgi:septation ring formation regulator EzrA